MNLLINYYLGYTFDKSEGCNAPPLPMLQIIVNHYLSTLQKNNRKDNIFYFYITNFFLLSGLVPDRCTTLYSTQYRYMVHCTLYSTVQLHGALYTVQHSTATWCTVQCTLYIIRTLKWSDWESVLVYCSLNLIQQFKNISSF